MAGIAYVEAGLPFRYPPPFPWYGTLGIGLLVLAASAFAVVAAGAVIWGAFRAVHWLAGLIGGPDPKEVRNRLPRR
jgi:hypothetical protein